MKKKMQRLTRSAVCTASENIRLDEIHPDDLKPAIGGGGWQPYCLWEDLLGAEHVHFGYPSAM